MLHIVFWARLALARELVIDRFQAIATIRFTVCRTLDDVIAALPDADGLLLYNVAEKDASRLMAAVADRAPRLRWMHFLTAGREGFDAAGIPPRIEVTQTAGATAPVVAEHAMALLLALVRRLPEAAAQAAGQRWDRGLAVRVRSIEGQVIAIVGYGRIGREVAQRARAFGMHVVALSRSGACDGAADEGQPLGALHAVLARSDVVLVAIALTADTRHLIDAAALAACRPGALLVNVARGAVVDSEALAEALRSGRLGGAALDVTDPEPLPAGHPLWQSPNLIVTPHLASEGSPPSERRLADGAVRALAKIDPGSVTTTEEETSP